MSGFSTRLKLWLKLWLTSLQSIVLLALIPLAVYFVYISQSYTIYFVASMIYEKVAPICFILILQWCFSIDFDSKFYRQIITYPVARSIFIVERLLVSTLIFTGFLSVVSMILTPFTGSFLWMGFAFTIPVYLGLLGFVVLGTVISHHSLGGLVAGLLYWIISVYGGALLDNLNVVLLVYQSVYRFVSGASGFFISENHWIIYNRLFYIGLGVILTLLAMLHFNRKSV